MKLRIILGLLVLSAAGLYARPLSADGLIRDGVGPISTGRGGANQAFADNSAIILDNPGALVNVAGDGLAEMGVDTVIPEASFSDPFNNVHNHTRPLPTPTLGYIQKSDDGCWAWGIGAFVPAGFGAAYGNLTHPGFGTTQYKSIGAVGKILPALSYRLTDRLSIGGSVGLAFSYVGLNGPYVVQDAPFTGLPAVVNLQGFGVAPTGSVGMQYQLFADTVIGASYTSPTDFQLHGGANGVLLIVPGGLQSHFDTKIGMKWPQSVAFGIKHSFCPHRRLGADVIWYDWASAFNQINLQFNNPTTPGLPPSLRDAFPLHWTNSVSLRLGYEWDPNDFDTWRVGYTYHGSPVPDATLNPFLDGVLEHGFSAGYSRKLSGGAILNLAYQYNFGKQRHVDTSAITGGLFDNTSFNAQAHFAMISLLFPF
jgi:long-chain fatty acid transport protein